MTPPGQATRPTLDRIREALFNALGSLDAVDDARVLDLFAGSGALGVEALSRGARHCTFVERATTARRSVQQNLDGTGLADRGTVVGGDALRFVAERAGAPVRPEPYDLVLLDPPYGTTEEVWAALLGHVARLAPDGVVVAESDRPIGWPPGWDVLREKRYGDTLVVIACPSSPPPEPS